MFDAVKVKNDCVNWIREYNSLLIASEICVFTNDNIIVESID